MDKLCDECGGSAGRLIREVDENGESEWLCGNCWSEKYQHEFVPNEKFPEICLDCGKSEWYKYHWR